MSATTPGNGRGPDGKFARGNRGGPGRPTRAVEEAYLEELRSIVTRGKWRAIVKQAVVDALGGNARARSWLAKYLLPTAAGLEALAEKREAEPDDEVSRMSPRELAKHILALPIMQEEAPEDAAG